MYHLRKVRYVAYNMFLVNNLFKWEKASYPKHFPVELLLITFWIRSSRSYSHILFTITQITLKPYRDISTWAIWVYLSEQCFIAYRIICFFKVYEKVTTNYFALSKSWMNSVRDDTASTHDLPLINPNFWEDTIIHTFLYNFWEQRQYWY